MIYPSIRVLSVAIACIPPLAGTCGSQARAAEPFDQFPIAITCEYKNLHQVFYLTRLDADGVATYINPSKLAGTISVRGTAKALGEPVGGSCLGKTLEQLRASGQVLDLKR
ncbi:hypothetical protein U8P80_14390 [Rhizobium beringeri]|jgi:hypothetical protein|uniref:Uncharacterized protein n=1 Tax=Rhizobium beringeri TaxID=3019934 RepID=A0ABY1XVH7_9HYPH|nr:MULTISPECIES: hypothetical protein [Rhizobium]NKL67276.1 hypothetical protein [Rhizobium leguminosarum bv. viciae]RWX15132.1 hypothetical protein EHI45_11005 [Rhizobium leguminosarum]TBC73531.1 hypothetical protein ELH27_12035 [Rhizobium leguminosarum]TBD05235.1 hypothetical protein ELH21_12900 [Rhizobium leguminosarum]TBE71402.1 hypothetical protein ELH03_11915 [Rhizobium beringeri]